MGRPRLRWITACGPLHSFELVKCCLYINKVPLLSALPKPNIDTSYTEFTELESSERETGRETQRHGNWVHGGAACESKGPA